MTTPFENGFWLHREEVDEAYELGGVMTIAEDGQGGNNMNDLTNGSFNASIFGGSLLGNSMADAKQSLNLSMSFAAAQGADLFRSSRFQKLLEEKEAEKKLTYTQRASKRKLEIFTILYFLGSVAFLIVYVIPGVMLNNRTVTCTVDEGSITNITCPVETDVGKCVSIIARFIEDRQLVTETLISNDFQTSVNNTEVRCEFSTCAEDNETAIFQAETFVNSTIGDRFKCLLVERNDPWFVSQFYSPDGLHRATRGPKVAGDEFIFSVSGVYVFLFLLFVAVGIKTVQEIREDRRKLREAIEQTLNTEKKGEEGGSKHFKSRSSRKVNENTRRRINASRRNWN
eukprot:maker-scaffold_1-snap-gene-20.65-mRNA-1 protein AED:0.00 eAED:0.00 QI:334/1/1/1/1/1/2/305/341